MPIARFSAAVFAVLWLTGPAAYAQKGKGGPSTHGSGPKTTAPTSHGSSHAAGSPKTTTATSHGNPHTTTATPKTHGNPHTTTATTTTKTHGNPHTTATTGSSTSTGNTTTNTARSTTTLNPIAQKLQGKPLGDRIQQMLPKNTTLDAASAGFKNQGQFIAAVHVSQNLGIPFTQLKATMLGTSTTTATNTTSTNPMSLGQAIQRLRPTVNAGAEVERAETQATADANRTSITSTTATTSAAKSKKQKQ
jgi:hypothetical protein